MLKRVISKQRRAKMMEKIIVGCGTPFSSQDGKSGANMSQTPSDENLRMLMGLTKPEDVNSGVSPGV